MSTPDSDSEMSVPIHFLYESACKCGDKLAVPRSPIALLPEIKEGLEGVLVSETSGSARGSSRSTLERRECADGEALFTSDTIVSQYTRSSEDLYFSGWTIQHQLDTLDLQIRQLTESMRNQTKQEEPQLTTPVSNRQPDTAVFASGRNTHVGEENWEVSNPSLEVISPIW